MIKRTGCRATGSVMITILGPTIVPHTAPRPEPTIKPQDLALLTAIMIAAVTCGDMAVVELPDRYRLAYIVFNSLMNLLSQDEQGQCVANAARDLAEDGLFVVENVVPDAMYSLRHRAGVDQYVDAEQVGPEGVTVEVGRHDRVTQRVDKCHVGLSGAGVELDPIALRYIWPSELDLMARLASLQRRARWGDWSGEPFDARSFRHVSVYSR